MIYNWKKFNEEVNINLTESSYVTTLNDSRVDAGYNYDKNKIDRVYSKNCKIYWSIEIVDDKDEVVSIKPIINKVELTLVFVYYKVPYDEDEIDNTEEKEESYVFTKSKIDNSYKEEIQFPFKPRSLEFDLKEKSIKVDFTKYEFDED